MARIRRIKPEIWQSADFARLSVVGRLTFIALVTQADDEGRLRTDPQHLAIAFLHNPSLAPEIDAQLSEMARLGMIQRYKDAQKLPCVALPNFAAHQLIDKPTPSRIQKPPEKSGRSRRALPETSPTTPSLSKEGSKEGEEVSNEVGAGAAHELVERLSEILTQQGVRFKATKVWFVEADRLIRVDQRDPAEALAVLEWATSNAFWQPNILSLPKFREKYDQLRLQRERELMGGVHVSAAEQSGQRLLQEAGRLS